MYLLYQSNINSCFYISHCPFLAVHMSNHQANQPPHDPAELAISLGSCPMLRIRELQLRFPRLPASRGRIRVMQTAGYRIQCTGFRTQGLSTENETPENHSSCACCCSFARPALEIVSRCSSQAGVVTTFAVIVLHLVRAAVTDIGGGINLTAFADESVGPVCLGH